MKHRLLILILCALMTLTAAGCGTVPNEAGVPPVVESPTVTPAPVQPSEAPSPVPSPSPTPEPEPEPEPVQIKLQFAGDILLHSGPVKHAKTGDDTYDFRPYFEEIKPYLDGDLSICNMESPVDALGGNQGLSSYPMFNVPYEILEALDYAGFNHLLTANNHAFDKRAAGVEATLESIRRAGLTSTGTYADEASFDTPTVLDVQGVRVGIIAYTDSYNGLESTVPKERLPYLMRKFNSGSLDDLPKMLADIEAVRSAGAELVVFALHWGAEYVDKPTQTQRDIALALCEGGADIILGGHSHCVQPVEWVETERGARCLIMYSLGNFFADQIGMEKPIPKTQYGMLVDVNVTKTPDGIVSLDGCSVLPTLSYRGGGSMGDRYRLLPVDSGDAVPAFMPDEAAWEWGLRAREHVLKIVGPEFVR